MLKKDQPFETLEHDLAGYAALDFAEGGFNSLAHAFDNYNPERFEPVTLKISLEGGSFTLTLYALDKMKQASKAKAQNKLPVKKFKMMMEAADFFRHIYRFAAALSCEKFNIENMRVINK